MLLVVWLFPMLHWTKIQLLLNIKHDWEEIDYGSWEIVSYDKSLKFHKQNQKKDEEAPCVLSFLCIESAMCHTAFSLSMWKKKTVWSWNLGLLHFVYIQQYLLGHSLMVKKSLRLIYKYILLNTAEEKLISKVSPETKCDRYSIKEHKNWPRDKTTVA